MVNLIKVYNTKMERFLVKILIWQHIGIKKLWKMDILKQRNSLTWFTMKLMSSRENTQIIKSGIKAMID